MLKVLDLFSGIGGFSLGLERTGGFETVAFCEIEEFPRKVLAKHWPDVPCFEDVRELTYAKIQAAIDDADADKQRLHREAVNQQREREPIDGKERELGQIREALARSGNAGKRGAYFDGIGDTRERTTIDVICGGYPCQPFSHAGKRQGQEDDRHLWPEFSRLVDELRPAWVIGENVAGHISMGLDDVLSDLEGKGYACRPFVIPACAVDARHRRDRVWVVAYAKSERRRETRHDSERPAEWVTSASIMADACLGRFRREGSGESEQPRRAETIGASAVDADTDTINAQGRQTQRWAHSTGHRQVAIERRAGLSDREPDGRSWAWHPEPDVGRVAHGIPARVDRLKALGNAVVPQVVEMIGYAILESEQSHAREPSRD